MSITVCTGKLHCVKVTAARLDYEGSITIDRKLMDAAGIAPFQLVHINNMANAVHWETYAIPGAKGEIQLNGCPARLFHAGDKVIILSLEQLRNRKSFTSGRRTRSSASTSSRFRLRAEKPKLNNR
jgi:aspartate 1-decarboxylase